MSLCSGLRRHIVPAQECFRLRPTLATMATNVGDVGLHLPRGLYSPRRPLYSRLDARSLARSEWFRHRLTLRGAGGPPRQRRRPTRAERLRAAICARASIPMGDAAMIGDVSLGAPNRRDDAERHRDT